MSPEKNRHDGHKKRLRERFAANNDFTGFKEHEILEMLLNFVQVRKNMNNIAHDLLDKFGTLHAVFDASKEDLLTVDGVGERTATMIVMQRHLFGAYQKSKYDVTRRNSPAADFEAYIHSLFAGADKELFYMLCVGERGRITGSHLIGRGSGDSVLLDQRQIVKIAINSNAWGLIFAHNHITGIATPSQEDIKSTILLRECLDTVNIKLINHFIVAGDQCVSVLEDRRYKTFK